VAADHPGSPKGRPPALCQNRSVSDPPPPSRIVVGDLVIRRWRASDLEPLGRAIAESIEQLRPWLAWANTDRAGQGDFLTATMLAWERGERFEYAIEDRQGTLLGSVGLMRRIGPGGLEIGYWVHSAHAGNGIAKLAAAALTAEAFELPWVDHVEIHHDKANDRSGAVPAGLGFVMVAEVRKPILAAADTGCDLIWRLRRQDFAGSVARSLLDEAVEPV